MTDFQVIDVAIFLVLILGAIVGFKQGAIKTLAKLIGTFGAVVLAFYLKNPISVLLYTHLPFFKFQGIFSGVSVLNILLYEAIAYLVVFAILNIVFKTIIFFTGIIEKLLNLTIILGLASKLLGIVVGLVQAYLIIFVVIFCYDKYALFNEVKIESKMPNIILKETPILSGIIEDTQNTAEEIIGLKDMYKDSEDKNAFNTDALVILLKNKMITKANANQLIFDKKIVVDQNNSELKEYLD